MFSYLQLDDPDAPGVGVAFTDRFGGVSAPDLGPLNLGRTDVDSAEHVAANFAALHRELGLGQIVVSAQVHGADVLRVDADLADAWTQASPLGPAGGASPLPEADALVTKLRLTPALALCIRVADCVPVVLADAAAGVVGVAHAGREGFAAGVLPATVAALRGLGATALQAWIGPRICGGCYEVPAGMRAQLAAEHPAAYTETTWGTPALDLGAGCAAQLAELGVRVTDVGRCTREDAALHSHRRDGARAGRLGALVWLT